MIVLWTPTHVAIMLFFHCQLQLSACSSEDKAKISIGDITLRPSPSFIPVSEATPSSAPMIKSARKHFEYT